VRGRLAIIKLSLERVAWSKKGISLSESALKNPFTKLLVLVLTVEKQKRSMEVDHGPTGGLERALHKYPKRTD